MRYVTAWKHRTSHLAVCRSHPLWELGYCCVNASVTLDPDIHSKLTEIKWGINQRRYILKGLSCIVIVYMSQMHMWICFVIHGIILKSNFDSFTLAVFLLLGFQVLSCINEHSGDFNAVLYKHKCCQYGFMHSFFVNSEGHCKTHVCM